MNHTDYWTIARIIQEKALAAAQAWDVDAAKTLQALAAEFDAMGNKAEAKYLEEKAEWESHKYDGYDTEDVNF